MSNSRTPKTAALLLVAVFALAAAGCGDEAKDPAPDPNAAPPAPLATSSTGGSAKSDDGGEGGSGGKQSGDDGDSNGGNAGAGPTDNPGNPAGPGPGDEDRRTGVKIGMRKGKFDRETPKKVSVTPWIRVALDISALDDEGYRLVITQGGKKQVKTFPKMDRRIITTEPPEPDSVITLKLKSGATVRITANANPGP